ncbi:MAG TPA: aspartate/glutamate racemase family protein [Candidatus Eisenbergiella merdipullorum]|uniref:Aspartate/glutamate racemase family protein n=1 Tax=Candidatus Eisenbergiella merdipullorum TaxID=2838553 RepID=A0A9D2I9X2_9FIRM|nr:aspartate/glutamate racemase family protein [Candidatus Eisenbergiella merdipullorum]
MGKKIGIIHTTSATISSLNGLVRKKYPGTEIVNILDDSILGDMRELHNVDYVKERWISYAKILEKLGVDAVLSACSTVGEFAEEADQMLSIPVFRIDEAMCERAVEMGTVISVFATLASTLNPTVNLVERKAAAAGKKVTINTVLVEGAYSALMDGQKEVHDAKIAEAVNRYIDTSDVIVLAQASMADAVKLSGKDGEKVLTSPELGIEKLGKVLGL